MADKFLSDLQSTIEREIPLCAAMHVQVLGYDDSRALMLQAPLARNRNHHQTAFAGSLNALCTVAGWGTVFLLTREHELSGSIVIRRSAIKYLKPVDTPDIIARCRPVDAEQRQYFVEMLQDKGQAKIDLHVEICNRQQVAVSFQGSYVVLNHDASSI